MLLREAHEAEALRFLAEGLEVADPEPRLAHQHGEVQGADVLHLVLGRVEVAAREAALDLGDQRRERALLAGLAEVADEIVRARLERLELLEQPRLLAT